MTLTDAACRNAKPAAKPRKLLDDGGLYLLVGPPGKYWRWDYRHGGKRKTLALGVYPDVPLQLARTRLKSARAQLADGTDPAAQRKADKLKALEDAVKTLEATAGEWMAHQAKRWEPVTLGRIKASLQTYVFPSLGDRPIAAVRPREVLEMVKRIEERGAGDQAGRVLQRVKAIYRWAVTHGRIEVNPMVDLVPSEILQPRHVRHRAAMSDRELPSFLDKLEAYEGDPHTVLALRMLMLTATRPGEVRGATWDEFELDAALWVIPAERMKMRQEHRVPLSRQALNVLQLISAHSAGRGLVFPSPFYPGKPLSENTFNSALARMGYKGEATAHGFRALFSTVANEKGWRADVIERQLAHVERNEVRAAYHRATYMAERIELLQWWGDYLDARGNGSVLPIDRQPLPRAS